MTLRKLCWYLGQIFFLMLLEKIHCSLLKLEKNSGFILAHLWFKFLEYFNHSDRLERQIILASRMTFHRPVLNKQEQHIFNTCSIWINTFPVIRIVDVINKFVNEVEAVLCEELLNLEGNVCSLLWLKM